MENNKFVTLINCMDGRVQEPVIKWFKENYNAMYVDSITEAGPDCVICQGNDQQLNSIKEKVLISVNKHGSHIIGIAGHYDCAGHPVDDLTHKQDILKSVEIIKSWDLDVDVVGLWIDENWVVHRL